MKSFILKSSLVCASLAAVFASSAAFAAPVSDGAFLYAARCVGISKGLGVSAPELNAMYQKQGDTRLGWVIDQADQRQDDAAREARQSSGDQKAKLNAELDGPCKAIGR